MKGKTQAILLLNLIIVFSIKAQTLLEADGSGKPVELINAVLSPNFGGAIEFPGVKKDDCDNHSNAKEPHITEVFDKQLNKHVFKFVIHVDEDNDRCKYFDRQRNEIKTYRHSPDYLKGTEGETVEYKWKFKLDSSFKPSKNFTHVHQLKSVGEKPKSKPIITLTPREGEPSDMLELRYSSGPNFSRILKEANLNLFRGRWISVIETVTYSKKGAYSIVITNLKTGKTILEYKSKNLLLWQNEAEFVRPKWGIYRSLKREEALRDETLFFADFSITEK